MAKLIVNRGRFSPEVRQLRKEIKVDTELTPDEKRVGRTITDGMGISPACRLPVKLVSSRTGFSASAVVRLMTKGLKRYFAFIQPPVNDIWRRMLVSEGYQGKYIFFIRPGWLVNFDRNSKPKNKRKTAPPSLLVGALKSSSSFYIIYNLVYYILNLRYKREKEKEEKERSKRVVISSGRSQDPSSKIRQKNSSQQPPDFTPLDADFVGIGYADITNDLSGITDREELDQDSLEILSGIVNDPIMRQTFTSLYPDCDIGKLVIMKDLKPLEKWNCRDFVAYICMQLQKKYKVRVSPFSWKGDCIKVDGFLRQTRLTAAGYKEMIDWLVRYACTENFAPGVGYFASYNAYSRWQGQIPTVDFKSKLSPMMQSNYEFITSSQAELERMAAEQDKAWGMADMTDEEVEAEAMRILAKLGE